MLYTSALLLPEGLQEENSPPTAEVGDLEGRFTAGTAGRRGTSSGTALRRGRTREILRGLELLRRGLMLRGLTPRSSRETDSS